MTSAAGPIRNSGERDLNFLFRNFSFLFEKRFIKFSNRTDFGAVARPGKDMANTTEEAVEVQHFNFMLHWGSELLNDNRLSAPSSSSSTATQADGAGLAMHAPLPPLQPRAVELTIVGVPPAVFNTTSFLESQEPPPASEEGGGIVCKTSRVVWRMSQLMGHWMASHAALFDPHHLHQQHQHQHQLRVLELGCGLGLPSLACAKVCAAVKRSLRPCLSPLVVMTDGDAAALRLAEHNVNRNWPSAGNVGADGRDGTSGVPLANLIALMCCCGCVARFVLQAITKEDHTWHIWCGEINRP